MRHIDWGGREDGGVPAIEWPKVSFGFAVLNEERNLPRCLGSIRNQDYPKDKIEIVLADGGSTDRTVEIGREFGCKVIDNPHRLAEPGAVLAHQVATGDIRVFFAADNALPRIDWVRQMVAPFLADPEVWGSYTHIVEDPRDNSFNRYYSHLHVEPFTWFVYGAACNPLLFEGYYGVDSRWDRYVAYRFTPMTHPLLALAQGFCVRASFQRKKEYEEDDILPVIQMIEEGKRLAYVPEAGVYHYHLRGFVQFLKKYQWRIRNSLQQCNVGFDRRGVYLSRGRKLRKYLWVPYGLSLVLPLLHSVAWFLRDGLRCWFWHLPASAGLAGLIAYELVRARVLRLFKGGAVRG